jgi:hypothetical protein
MARLDAGGRLIAGGSAAVIVILLLGIPVGAWDFEGYALVVLVAAVVALAVAFVSRPSGAGASWPVRAVRVLRGPSRPGTSPSWRASS